MATDFIKSDIAILGAGPAGISAALTFGKKGIPCLLIDESVFPRPKICGDGLSGKVLDTLDKIDPEITKRFRKSSFITDSWSVKFFAPSLQQVEISFQPDAPDSPPGYICTRFDFDNFLLGEALKYPCVSFHGGTKIGNIQRDNNGWILQDTRSGKSFMTRLLLVATGPDRSVIRRIDPDYPPLATEGIGVRAYFDRVTGSTERHAIEIHFLKELLPWYLWIFPYRDGSANVGLALPIELARKKQQSLKELLFSLIEKYPHLKVRFENSSIRGKAEAHRLPYYTGQMKIGGEGYLMLGDAAHLVDPFTGEGISHAMISGMTAAESIAESRSKPGFINNIATIYQERLYHKLGNELALGLKLQKLARTPRLLNLVIGKAGKNEKVRLMLEEMLYSINSKGKLSRPLFYLKLLLGKY